MPSASEISPHARGRPSASSRTTSRRSGSPTVRMIVTRSSASADGWGIFSRVLPGTGTTDMVELGSMFPKIWKFGSGGRVDEAGPGARVDEGAPATQARRLSPALAYAFAAAVIGLALFASGTPSPLYTTYRELWGFSPVVLTLVYATYAFGVLAALVLVGRISDEVGRRPVLLAALGTLMVTTVLFMVADSVVWLFVARGVQGV